MAVKSVIIDIADRQNTGANPALGIRSVDFYLAGDLIPMTSGFTADATSTWNITIYPPSEVFNTDSLKTGTWNYESWISAENAITNQRLLIYFDTPIDFDKIVINNSHSSGFNGYTGAKNIVITSSTDEITDTTYNATITNATILFDGALTEHVASDVEDPEVVWENFAYFDLSTPLVAVNGFGLEPIFGDGNFVSPFSKVLGSTYQLLYGDLHTPSPLVLGTGKVSIISYGDYNSLISSIFSDSFNYRASGVGNCVPVLSSLNGTLVNEIRCNGNFIVKQPIINSDSSVTIISNGKLLPKCIKIHGNYGSIGRVSIDSPIINSYVLNTIFGYGDIVDEIKSINAYGQITELGVCAIITRIPSIASNDKFSLQSWLNPV